jgi:hypothetical protein
MEVSLESEEEYNQRKHRLISFQIRVARERETIGI